MRFAVWFLVPTLVICHECANYQFGSLRKHTSNFVSVLDSPKGANYYRVLISDDISTNALRPFWKSTGFCPADPHQEAFTYFLSSDMKQNLFHIASLPYNGITRIRMHWLLDLVQISIKPDFHVLYNFTYLDQLIHEFWKNDLYIGFELMGNPSNFFTDFENATQVYMWRDFIHALTKRYIDIYGIQFVMEWDFETWNEPDHHDFDNLNFTIQGFLNYYDASSEGLKLAAQRLKFGGPGGSCRVPGEGHSPICWALMNHCIKGRNFFTGKIGSRLDFISFHKKGDATTLPILNEEWETIEYMRNQIKVPKNIPFYNDEADPMKNWALPAEWRTDVTYAAMVVKIILSHIDRYCLQNETRDVSFGLLSSDNAFLSYFPHQFSQRTLLARFQVNNTNPHFVEFVKKPVYSVFGLLGQLCPSILHSEIYYEGKQIKNMNEFGIVATHCVPERNQIVLLMYNSADSVVSNLTFYVDVTLKLPSSIKKGLQFPVSAKNARWISLELNNQDTNPYSIWKSLGKPAYPTTRQFRMIKDVEEPTVNGPWKLKNSTHFEHRLKILNPGVTMIKICTTRPLLKKVQKIRFFEVRNNSLQISWIDKNNRCVLTYILEHSKNLTGPYIQLNSKRVVFPSYSHSCKKNEINCSVRGFYRIYTVDYWYIRGPASKPAEYRD